MTDWTQHLNNLANQLWRLSPACRKQANLASLKLVAHRGAYIAGNNSPAPENTLPAFDRCLTHNIWGIELDVRLTQDGEPVVHHDPACGRLFQRPDLDIANISFATLRRELPQIPHLQDVIARYGKQLHLMIELKESWRQRRPLQPQLTRLLTELEPGEDYHLLSLEPDHLEGFRHLPPAALMDVALTNTKEIIRQNHALGHGAVAGSFALLSEAWINQLKATGKLIGTGQVNHPDIANREAARGINWVFSDQPLRLLGIRDDS
ncbi:glycerophosphoryl diester phosphodiesterase [Arsukibacterium tuosuense]|uniref:Glycerophosphoryl diester phosphodiesterase n=1 Tax=Arsukibacterium tuosuense TaxID=1323745 RepID=A0A285I3V8_9GAMM|nr:glycerophosphodiester phosphodiesterase [Arsukibacterium tuosuense]SNY42639.1 glycerophosphoryl diester phosphodiesterase [Arsukibacterium tuosuense]